MYLDNYKHLLQKFAKRIVQKLIFGQKDMQSFF
jgi:hypothetical protein